MNQKTKVVKLLQNFLFNMGKGNKVPLKDYLRLYNILENAVFLNDPVHIIPAKYPEALVLSEYIQQLPEEHLSSIESFVKEEKKDLASLQESLVYLLTLLNEQCAG